MAEFNNREAAAVQAWVIKCITDVADNYEPWYRRFKAAAKHAALNDMGSPAPTVEDYLTARRNGDTRDYEDVVGLAVVDELRQLLDGGLRDGSPVKDLMAELLDLNDRQQAALLGQHYLPEAWEFEED